MQSNFVVRLIDLTLLLLLSLLAVVKITEFNVELPVSRDLEDQGAILDPIQAAVSADGSLMVAGLGNVNALELARISAEEQRPIELRVDANADAFLLVQIHRIFKQADRPAVFIVEHRSR